MALALINAGYADNLMFSSDLARETFIQRNGGPGYAKTLSVFVPKVKAAGGNDEVLRKIMVDNPRRLLAFLPKKRRTGPARRLAPGWAPRRTGPHQGDAPGKRPRPHTTKRDD